jgi:hypothetical protein
LDNLKLIILILLLIIIIILLWNGNECGKKVMRISRQPFPVKHTIDLKELESMEFF